MTKTYQGIYKYYDDDDIDFILALLLSSQATESEMLDIFNLLIDKRINDWNTTKPIVNCFII